MARTYLGVVNTGNCGQKVMHSAAQPYALVECEHGTGRIVRVLSRYASFRGACIACARRAKGWR